jgi:hypothetical protein
MPTYTFAQIPDIIAKYERRMEAVAKESAQRVAIEVKRRTRRRTGFLRASLLASTSGMPMIDRNAKPLSDDAMYPDDGSQIALVIAGAALDKPIYLGFTASYALPREYYDGMVRLTAQQWPAIVSEVVREAVARIP